MTVWRQSPVWGLFDIVYLHAVSRLLSGGRWLLPANLTTHCCPPVSWMLPASLTVARESHNCRRVVACCSLMSASVSDSSSLSLQQLTFENNRMKSETMTLATTKWQKSYCNKMTHGHVKISPQNNYFWVETHSERNSVNDMFSYVIEQQLRLLFLFYCCQQPNVWNKSTQNAMNL